MGLSHFSEVRFIDSWWWSSFVWRSNNSNFCHFLKNSVDSQKLLSLYKQDVKLWKFYFLMEFASDWRWNIHHVAFQYIIWDISRVEKLSSSKAIWNSDLDTRDTSHHHPPYNFLWPKYFIFAFVIRNHQFVYMTSKVKSYSSE